MRSSTNFVSVGVSVLFILAAGGDAQPSKLRQEANGSLTWQQSEAEDRVNENSTAEIVSFFTEVDRQSFLEWLFSIQSESKPDQPVATAAPPAHCEPCVCGESFKSTRIVGGYETKINQYPWMALMMYDRKFYCGGTLINDRYVLTASHCVDGFNKQRMTVRLMEHDRSTPSETITIERQVDRILMHGSYSDVTFNNDIALVRLSQPVKFTKDLRPVCLPPRGSTFKGYNGIVTGWGLVKQGGGTSQILNEVTVPIISNDECRRTGYGSKRITDNMLCAGFSEGKKDACQGDSGGPLHVKNNTRHVIVGVVSWGEGCARPKYPGVYARVNRYVTWITRNTQDACYCNELRPARGKTGYDASPLKRVSKGPRSNLESPDLWETPSPMSLESNSADNDRYEREADDSDGLSVSAEDGRPATGTPGVQGVSSPPSVDNADSASEPDLDLDHVLISGNGRHLVPPRNKART